MPAKAKFTQQEITEAALSIVRAEGMKGLTARSLGAKLGSSARPIFTVFQNMEEVQQEVLKAAYSLYHDYLDRFMAAGKYPVYKASGMAYIQFAKEEKELFRLLFMRERSDAEKAQNSAEVADLVKIIRRNTGLSEQDALLFHLEMWAYVHGIAVMIVTDFYDWTEELISRVLTDGYESMKQRYQERRSC